MKSFVWTLMLLALPLIAYSGDNTFFLTDLYEAQTLSVKNDKNIFVYYFEDNCTFCKMADDSLFANQDIRKYLTANFISVKANFKNQLYASWYEKYNVTCLPTMQIINPEGELIFELKGTTDALQFMEILRDYQELEASPAVVDSLIDTTLYEEEAKPVMEDEEVVAIAVQDEDVLYYTVQLGAFRVFNNVINYRKTLESDYDLSLSIHESSDENLYRIFLGQFQTKSEALVFIQEVKALGIDYWFRSVKPSQNYFELQVQ